MVNHFKVKELVPKVCYERWGELSLRYMDSRIIACLNYIREVVQKPINVNNAQFDARTLRTQASNNYSTWSGHSFGRCIDFDVVGMDSLDVQRLITKDIIHSAELKKLGLTAIEDATKGWTHISCEYLEGWGFAEVNGIKLIPIPK